jgi:adenosine/AMP kinase
MRKNASATDHFSNLHIAIIFYIKLIPRRRRAIALREATRSTRYSTNDVEDEVLCYSAVLHAVRGTVYYGTIKSKYSHFANVLLVESSGLLASTRVNRP